MKSILLIIGIAALGLTIVPPILFAAGMIDDGGMKLAMLIGAAIWFATAPRLMRPENP